jgi:hypothetical protein
VKTFQVREALFKTHPLFVIDCSHRALDAYLRKRFHVDAGEDVQQIGQMFTFQQPPLRVVWVERRPHDLPTLATLLHEIFHLVTRICQDKGVPIKAQIEEGHGDETAAYLFEFLAREAFAKAGLVVSQPRGRAPDRRRTGWI